ncbi:MAG: hypothetical protein MO847_11750 [Candidatus Protistobacter heckmanni]|nr:hypothetical protein [Candidatus Protistobacter heckmanni]
MRLTDEELLHLVEDLESDRVERKESFKGDAPEKVRKQYALLQMTSLVTISLA